VQNAETEQRFERPVQWQWLFRRRFANGPEQVPPLVAGAAGIAAAGAFLWTRRGQIGEVFNNGLDRLSELKAERMGSGQSQSEIAEEALTLKETGKKSKGPRGPLAQQGHQGRDGHR
jgi:hypothetical protein